MQTIESCDDWVGGVDNRERKRGDWTMLFNSVYPVKQNVEIVYQTRINCPVCGTGIFDDYLSEIDNN